MVGPSEQRKGKDMKKTCFFVLVALLAVAASASAGEREGRVPRILQREGRVLPQVPVVMDGVRYTPGEMAGLQGRLFYVVDREALDQGFVWAFTTAAGAEEHLARGAAEREQLPEKTCPIARFNKVAYGTGTDWLVMYCGQTTSYVGSNWNNTISYVEGGGSFTILYSVDNFGGDTFTVAGGAVVQDLHPYGFNNRTSSIKVCPEGTSYTDCLIY
jgi:hypothetical protein